MRKRARMGSFSLGCWICWLIAAVLSLECAKTCSAAVCHENVWAASAEKRCRLLKSKPAGSQRNKKPAGSQYKPTKSKWAYPVYIKKNQRDLAEKLAQREITEMNLKNAGLRTG